MQFENFRNIFFCIQNVDFVVVFIYFVVMFYNVALKLYSLCFIAGSSLLDIYMLYIHTYICAVYIYIYAYIRTYGKLFACFEFEFIFLCFFFTKTI